MSFAPQGSLHIPERRRAPRVEVDGRSWLAVRSTWPVQLADLGIGGLALSSPYALTVGREVSLRTTLGREAFTGQVRVCWARGRHAASHGRPRFEMGGAFLSLEESSRRALQSFLKLPGTE